LSQRPFGFIVEGLVVAEADDSFEVSVEVDVDEYVTVVRIEVSFEVSDGVDVVA